MHDPQRRFTGVSALSPSTIHGLPDTHKAVKNATTLFPNTVVDASASPRLLVSGHNSRKIGDRVVKGPWKGMPIYTLTLEERATCPKDCFHWKTCYGNGMPLARRHRHGLEFERLLRLELMVLNEKHSNGFVVRLHILGDFYSVGYAMRWYDWLVEFPNLYVFGYTAWQSHTIIGKIVRDIAKQHWDRFAVRTSSESALPMGATTLWEVPAKAKTASGVVCPMQLNKTACCGTCGLCWEPNFKDKTISFIAHGRKKRKVL